MEYHVEIDLYVRSPWFHVGLSRGGIVCVYACVSLRVTGGAQGSNIHHDFLQVAAC